MSAAAVMEVKQEVFAEAPVVQLQAPVAVTNVVMPSPVVVGAPTYVTYAAAPMAMAPQPVTYAAAPTFTYAAPMPGQVTYTMAPAVADAGQVTYLAAQPGMEAGQVVYSNAAVMAAGQMVEESQVEGVQAEGEAEHITYAAPPVAVEEATPAYTPGQVVYMSQPGVEMYQTVAPVATAGGAQVMYMTQPGTEMTQMTYAAPTMATASQFVYAAPSVAAAPAARVTVPSELFAKLAAGGTLTAEEMATISGQPASQAAAPIEPDVPLQPTIEPQPVTELAITTTDAPAVNIDAKADAKETTSSTKKKEKTSKKAMKASKKSKKGCC